MSFFPGAIGAGDFWSPVAALLPPAWERQLLSWPGAGSVPPVPEVNGYDDLVELAARAVADGGDVVAQSMGCLVALGLALRYPAKVRRLVLAATSGGLDVSVLGAAAWREQYRAEFPRAAAWVTEESRDLSAALPTLHLPACLIWGDADPISPVAVGEALHAQLPQSTLHVIAGGTHDLARERPEQVAALIRRHLG